MPERRTVRRPKPIDVWCPACGAEPWTKCVPYVPPNRLARELGFPPVRVLVDADGHFRAAKR